MLWYIRSGELFSPSVFHALHGQFIGSRDAVVAPYIVRLRHIAMEASGGLCTGCMIIDDGATVWSDFSGDVSLAISDFLRLQEHKATRYSTEHEMGEIQSYMPIRYLLPF